MDEGLGVAQQQLNGVQVAARGAIDDLHDLGVIPTGNHRGADALQRHDQIKAVELRHKTDCEREVRVKVQRGAGDLHVHAVSRRTKPRHQARPDACRRPSLRKCRPWSSTGHERLAASTAVGDR